jgi:hypothetical protein
MENLVIRLPRTAAAHFFGWIIFSRHHKKSDFSAGHTRVLPVAFEDFHPAAKPMKTLAYIAGNKECRMAARAAGVQLDGILSRIHRHLHGRTCGIYPGDNIQLLADRDTATGESGPVLGANDGASGVAVLLELARTLPFCRIPLMLVFFDGEDNGGLNGMEWIMGSRVFTRGLTQKPHAAIIVDMVGDADLDLYIEKNSRRPIQDIWVIAELLQALFHPGAKYAVLMTTFLYRIRHPSCGYHRF